MIFNHSNQPPDPAQALEFEFTPKQAGITASTPETVFRWPSPPIAEYSDAANWSDPQECDIEGPTGGSRHCTLFAIVPAEKKILIQIERARSMVSLAFSHFYRLILASPIRPKGKTGNTAFSDEFVDRNATAYRVILKDGKAMSGLTMGHVETPFGLFLYTPINDQGSLQREFIPREAYQRLELPGSGSELAASVVAPVKPVAKPVLAAALEARFDESLNNDMVFTPEQLLKALDQQNKMPMIRLGEALTRMGYVTDKQLKQALELKKDNPGEPLGQLLVSLGFLTRKKLTAAMVHKMGYPVVDLARFPIEPAALQNISMATAQRLMIVPLLSRPNLTVVAAADPTQRKIFEELEFLVQGRVMAVLADDLDIRTAIDNAYQKLGFNSWSMNLDLVDFPETAPAPASSSQLLETMELHELQEQQAAQQAADDSEVAQSDNTLVRLINTMIMEAHDRGVSDIHVETLPHNAKVRIRFRKDGLLSPYLELPHTYRATVVARLKIMANLDIAEHRKPQDGKIDFHKFAAKYPLELRIATVPTTNGLEDVVMRLLSSTRPVAMDKLGLTAVNLQQLRDAVNRPYGMVLCVGPTGSGKTTSLHSVLSYLNTPERKIWTAEDPIEITQPDLRQVQVNPHIEWTFAKALRSFLRADPDIIMVGEIRDVETAHIAIEASLTGHLLLSTLHTNSAAETVTRLIDMGMNPFNFADSLLAVLAQRLVRRLCTQCRRSAPAPQTWVEELLDDYSFGFPDELRPERSALRVQWLAQYSQQGQLNQFAAPGCSHCQGTGYAGRMGLHELMRVTPGLRRLIQTSARSELVQNEAFKTGEFRTLRQDGIIKVLEGHTSIEEVRANSNG
jgi:type II secretory ATPase GspE/PulE/Tfp pilus assembly ATPase PilB-like protein